MVLVELVDVVEVEVVVVGAVVDVVVDAVVDVVELDVVLDEVVVEDVTVVGEGDPSSSPRSARNTSTPAAMTIAAIRAISPAVPQPERLGGGPGGTAP